MNRDQIRRRIAKAVDAIERGNSTAGAAMLRSVLHALEPKPKQEPAAPVAEGYDQPDLALLRQAFGRAQAGTITAAEVNQLVKGLERLPVAQAVALARAFGCTWLPLRATRKAALAAIADTLLGPIEARERATF